MFVLLGVVFIVYEGTSALTGLYESNGATDIAFAAEEWASELTRNVPFVAVAISVALLTTVYLYRRHHRNPRNTADNGSQPGQKDSRKTEVHQ